MKDYYEILGISRSASKEEIKKAFYKMAHKYHPDKKEGDEKKFKEINEAYQTLADDQKRARYDQFGPGFENMGSSHSGQGFGGFSGGSGQWDFSGFSRGGGIEFDLNDIFSDFFGGNMRSGFSRTPRGRDMQTEISISLIDSILGSEKKIIINGKKEITIKIPAGIQNGQTLKMTGYGEQIKNGKSGDLYIKIKLKMPNKISKKAKELLEELKKEGL